MDRKKLLRLLLENGRMSARDIAEKLDVKESEAAAEIQAMEEGFPNTFSCLTATQANQLESLGIYETETLHPFVFRVFGKWRNLLCPIIPHNTDIATPGNRPPCTQMSTKWKRLRSVTPPSRTRLHTVTIRTPNAYRREGNGTETTETSRVHGKRGAKIRHLEHLLQKFPEDFPENS